MCVYWEGLLVVENFLVFFSVFLFLSFFLSLPSRRNSSEYKTSE